MCKIRAKIKGKEIVLQTMGYRGKKEARSDFGDVKQCRSFIVYKADAQRLGLRVGQTVTVTIAGRRLKCKVKKWSRGSRLLLPSKEYPLKDLTRREFSKIHVKD